MQPQTLRVPYIGGALFLFHFILIVLKDVPATSNIVQDLGDNFVEAEGGESIVFPSALNIGDSCTTVYGV